MLLLRVLYGGSAEHAQSGKAMRSFKFSPDTLVGDVVAHVLSR